MPGYVYNYIFVWAYMSVCAYKLRLAVAYINHLQQNSVQLQQKMLTVEALFESEAVQSLNCGIQARFTAIYPAFRTSRYQSQRLRKLQNREARLVTRPWMLCYVTPLLKELHWLPVLQRVKFKMLLYVYPALHGEAPTYVRDMLDLRVPTRTLRSGSNEPLLVCK